MAGKQALETEPIAETMAEDEARSARSILYDIGQEFNRLLKKNTRAQAYKYLQSELMKNMDRLVPNVIPLKDHISTVTGLEEFLKGSLGATSKPPLDALAEWLQGKDIQ